VDSTQPALPSQHPTGSTPQSPPASPPQPPPPPPPGATTAGSHRYHPPEHPKGARLALLSLTALGVVYGDIGTSVLYAIKECFDPVFGVAVNEVNIYGVLSLIVWSLTLVISVKYIVFILRADNRGEGGTMALVALIMQRLNRRGDRKVYILLVLLGLFGASLVYGDGIITPAISVFGAMEGLVVISPTLATLVVPFTVIILLILFFFQRHGTSRVGVVFGPIMLVWFATIAVLGIREIALEPQILLAINPWYAARFFIEHGFHGILILGAVVLVITGGEALYADMGHFGRRPIRLAWFSYVFPALLINYFGQGALLLRDPTAVDNPFFRLVPEAMRYPILALATVAAVVASQSLISGAFSITRQGIQLGYFPRMTVKHTSAREAGQIYIPEVNKAMAAACITLVLIFQSARNLAAAYGIAVTGTMVITTLLFDMIANRRFRWSIWKSLAFLTFFLIIDVSFAGANMVKIQHGGWFPIVVAAIVYLLMSTWKRGRASLAAIQRSASLPLDLFLTDVERNSPPRVPGTAVFMSSDPNGAPVVLLHHLKHNKVLHKQVILLSVMSSDVPEVPDDERITVQELGQGFYRVLARYGFMEAPHIPDVLAQCNSLGLRTKPSDTSFYLGRERLIPRKGNDLLPREEEDGEPVPKGMAFWRKKLFTIMSRNARGATEFFGIPSNRVVELGTQIEF
jgi:KUP system potassium uptake protein